VEAEEAADDEETDEQKPQTQKPKVKRTEEEIRLSLQKHNFSKAEFFLLTLANYDSASLAYSRFIESSEDSVLVPKAHYALYYIYSYELNDQVKADSLKQLILYKYPESAYAKFLTNEDATIDERVDKESPYKFVYLEGEAMLYDERYPEAIGFFNQIAEEDSGSDLAQKARYATAWIYENKLDDSESAVSAYTILAQEYPNTDAGRIAQNKIKAPPAEIDTSDVMLADSLISTPSDSTIFNDSDEAIPSLDEELDLEEQENNQDNTEDQDPDL
jgi:outer membrane protein assembly factor BamD (BamD/ComL family)